MTRRRRARMASVVVLALVFVVGVLTGIVADRWSTDDGSELLAGVPSEDPAEEAEPESERGWIIHRVDLDPEQRTAVDSMLVYYRALVRELVEGHNEAWWAVVQSTRDDMRAILREDQRIRYDSLLADRDQRRRRDAN